MKQEFLFLSADHKTQLHACKWIPVLDEIKGVLQITHGMQEYIMRYEGFADYLNQHGWVVVGHDHLGHGASAADDTHLGYFCKENPSATLVQDMHRLRKQMQKEYPDVPYMMLGHSMGSYLLRKYLAKYADGLQGAIIVGTGYVNPIVTLAGLSLVKILTLRYGEYHRSLIAEKLMFGKPSHGLDFTGTVYERSWLSKDVESVQKYYADPWCTYKFTLNGYKGLMDTVFFDCQDKNVKRIRKDLPILIASGDTDPIGNYGKGVRKVYQMMQKAGILDVSMKLYENDRHELLNEIDKEQVYKDFLDWMEEHI